MSNRGNDTVASILREERGDVTEFDYNETGMTIRERLVMAAMHGLLSNPSITRDERRIVSRLAVKHADDALEELERSK